MALLHRAIDSLDQEILDDTQQKRKRLELERERIHAKSERVKRHTMTANAVKIAVELADGDNSSEFN